MGKPKLIDNWAESYKWFSMQGMGIVSAGLTAYAFLPDKLQDALPVSFVAWFSAGILIVSMIARLIHQPPKPRKPKKHKKTTKPPQHNTGD